MQMLLTSRRQSSLRRPLVQLLASVILLFLVIQLWSDRRPPSIGDDSRQYHQIAMELRTGTFFAERPTEDLPIGFVVRTPGFPLILALGQALTPASPRLSLLIPHTLLLLLVVAFLRTKSGGQLPALVSVLALCFSLPQTRVAFGKIGSEWSAFVFSILLIAASCQFLRDRSPRSLFLVALLAAVDILIKPALVYLLTIPVILPLLSARRIRGFLVSVLGLLPLLTWLGFNYLRFDQVTLAPIAGYGLIFTGAMVGGAEADRFSDPTTREFAHRYNAIRPRFDESEISDFNRNPRPRPKELYQKYHSAIIGAFDVGSPMGVDYVEFNEILKTYSIEAIRLHPGQYIRHVVSALKNISLPILLLMALISGHSSLRYRDNQALAYSFFAAFFHVGLLLLTAIVQPIDARYYALSIAVPYFYLVVVVYLYARAILADIEAGDGTALSTEPSR